MPLLLRGVLGWWGGLLHIEHAARTGSAPAGIPRRAQGWYTGVAPFGFSAARAPLERRFLAPRFPFSVTVWTRFRIRAHNALHVAAYGAQLFAKEQFCE